MHSDQYTLKEFMDLFSLDFVLKTKKRMQVKQNKRKEAIAPYVCIQNSCFETNMANELI